MQKVSATCSYIIWRPTKCNCRFTVATNLLSCYEIEDNNFLSRIVNIDKTWVESYEPEMERQPS